MSLLVLDRTLQPSGFLKTLLQGFHYRINAFLYRKHRHLIPPGTQCILILQFPPGNLCVCECLVIYSACSRTHLYPFVKWVERQPFKLRLAVGRHTGPCTLRAFKTGNLKTLQHAAADRHQMFYTVQRFSSRESFHRDALQPSTCGGEQQPHVGRDEKDISVFLHAL